MNAPRIGPGQRHTSRLYLCLSKTALRRLPLCSLCFFSLCALRLKEWGGVGITACRNCCAGKGKKLLGSTLGVGMYAWGFCYFVRSMFLRNNWSMPGR